MKQREEPLREEDGYMCRHHEAYVLFHIQKVRNSLTAKVTSYIVSVAFQKLWTVRWR